jgi:hypothetical protein
MHAGNVALVYNPETTHLSPQFHVAFDDTFSSVGSASADHTEAVISSLLEKTAWLYSDSYAPPTTHHYFLQDQNLPSPFLFQAHHVSLIAPPTCPTYKPIRASQAFEEWKQANGIAANVFAPVFPSRSPAASIEQPQASTNTSLLHGSSEGAPHGAFAGVPPAFSEGALKGTFPCGKIASCPAASSPLAASQILPPEGALAFFLPLSSEGAPSFHAFPAVPTTGVWSYRRKRTPAGILQIYTARIFTDGLQQQYGIDYWETYAPVVSWSTVCLLLTLASIHGWHSSQIDFAQAFTQPPIAEEIYMKIPQGWQVVDGQLQQHENPKFRDIAHYIKLKKSLYGIKQAVHT